MIASSLLPYQYERSPTTSIGSRLEVPIGKFTSEHSRIQRHSPIKMNGAQKKGWEYYHPTDLLRNSAGTPKEYYTPA